MSPAKRTSASFSSHFIHLLRYLPPPLEIVSESPTTHCEQGWPKLSPDQARSTTYKMPLGTCHSNYPSYESDGMICELQVTRTIQSSSLLQETNFCLWYSKPALITWFIIKFTSELLRTRLIIIASFSRPCMPSAVPISRPGLAISRERSCDWAWYL